MSLCSQRAAWICKVRNKHFTRVALLKTSVPSSSLRLSQSSSQPMAVAKAQFFWTLSMDRMRTLSMAPPTLDSGNYCLSSLPLLKLSSYQEATGCYYSSPTPQKFPLGPSPVKQKNIFPSSLIIPIAGHSIPRQNTLLLLGDPWGNFWRRQEEGRKKGRGKSRWGLALWTISHHALERASKPCTGLEGKMTSRIQRAEQTCRSLKPAL